MNKICLDCGERKDAASFQKDKLRKDGLSVYCKPCSSVRSARYYERKYGSTHPLKKLKGLPAWERFFLSFDVGQNGCWMWRGHPTGSNSYGRIKTKDGPMMAHRFSWTLHYGPIPSGLFVLHRCDTPLCVNPSHLWLGTGADNERDKVEKGRQARGPELARAQQLGKLRKRIERGIRA